jgi:hypothetical protein
MNCLNVLEPRDCPPVRATKRPGQCKSLKEKPWRSFQLFGGFKQAPAAHTFLALLVASTSIESISSLAPSCCLESPQKFRLTAMHFPIFNAKSRSNVGDDVATSRNSWVRTSAFWNRDGGDYQPSLSATVLLIRRVSPLSSA